MSARQIILDTETTGLRVEEGHRIIEIGCVEMIDRKLTQHHFHHYIQPEREIDAGALAVHGISNEFLADKPLFASLADDFLTFVQDAELIIHNASFDIGFLDYELALTRRAYKNMSHYCQVVDTLQLARRLHSGQRNSLDALCKRYAIDNTKRELHGALLDAHLLAQVYLAMTGGQGSFFDMGAHATGQSMTHHSERSDTVLPLLNSYNLPVLKATSEELTAHQTYLQKMQAEGQCAWLEN